jgi:hypothetical protein
MGSRQDNFLEATPRINDTGSILLSPRVYLKVWKKGNDFLQTPCILDSWESIFDYEYFRKLKAKIENA